LNHDSARPENRHSMAIMKKNALTPSTHSG
jgi:hypothetical protein